MHIKRLVINDFRNLEYVELDPCEGFNFICGPNGSGKTSIIEAIHYLSLARSFRTNVYQYLIRQGAPAFNIFALVHEDNESIDCTLGLSRSRGEKPVIKINSDPISRMVDLIDHICVQIIHPQGVDLITKEAEGRRGFIDWGVYYTDAEFKSLWLKYRKVLKQRNSLLRREYLKAKGLSTKVEDSEASNGSFLSFNDEISIWNESIAVLSEQITQKRLNYLNDLQVILQDIIGQFLPNFTIKFELNFGWEKSQDLRSLLAQNLEKDKALGYTLYGCHRADLRIKNNTISAGATLSRGQLKMLVYALRLAQGMLLKEQSKKACIYLIDDLNSELDDNSQKILLNTLLQCNHQVFISNIQQELFFPKDRSEYKIFSLNQGMVV